MWNLFAFTAADHWKPGIGDPTVIGWVTVVGYALAAWLCWRAARSARMTAELGRTRLFWTLFSLGLVLLGINKQLDLQTWFTLFAKHLALDEGWYAERRVFQAAFIAAVAVGGAASLAGMKRLAGKTTTAVRVALAGGIFLGCFILIRASSFHHVDQMLGMKLGGLKVNGLLELGSIGCIAAAAWFACASAKKPSDGSQNFVWVTAGDRLKTPGGDR
jgi:hypothetical protein